MDNYGFLIWVNGTERLIDIEAPSEEEAHKKIREFCDEHFEKIEKIEFLGKEVKEVEDGSSRKDKPNRR